MREFCCLGSTSVCSSSAVHTFCFLPSYFSVVIIYGCEFVVDCCEFVNLYVSEVSALEIELRAWPWEINFIY